MKRSLEQIEQNDNKKSRTQDSDIQVLLNQNGALFFYNRGNNYLQEGEHEQAIIEYKKAIKLEPNNADFFCNLSDAYSENGQYHEAFEAAVKSVELEPNKANAFWHLDFAYNRLHKSPEQIAAYERATKACPNNAKFFNDLGSVNLNFNDIKGAAVAFKKAVELEPNNVEYIKKLGNAYSILGRHQDAIFEYEKAIKLEPNNAESFYDLGYAYCNLQRLSEAVVAHKKAVELKPDNAKYVSGLGNAYFKSNLFLEAITQLKKAVELDSKATLDSEATRYKMNLAETIVHLTEKVSIEKSKFIESAMLTYAEAGGYGEDEIIKFLTKHSKDLVVKKNALPALKLVANRYFEQENYFKALDFFGRFLEIKPNSFVELVNAKIAAQNCSQNLPGPLRLEYDCKIQKYHSEATKFLPLYAKFLVQIFKSHDIYELDILNKVISFLMPEQTLQSIKEPGEILKLLGGTPSVHIGELKPDVEIAGNSDDTQE